MDKRAPGYERRHVNAASSATGGEEWNSFAHQSGDGIATVQPVELIDDQEQGIKHRGGGGKIAFNVLRLCRRT